MKPSSTDVPSDVPSDVYYNAIAKGYNQLHGDEQLRKLQQIAAMIPHGLITPATKILDVGCGTGISSDFWVYHFGAIVTGIDPSKELIAQNTHKKSLFRVASAEKLPFPDHFFDIVVSLTAIQNFTDVAKGLSEIRRVAKGIFFLTVLKKAPTLSDIDKHIRSEFHVTHVLEDDHDIIYLVL